MRVLLVLDSAADGGAERQTTRLAHELDSAGVEVRVHFLLAGGPRTTYLEEHGIPWTAFTKPVSAYGLGKVVSRLKQFILLVRTIGATQPDLIHGVMPITIVGVGLIRRLGIARPPAMASFRGELRSKSKLKTLLYRALIGTYGLVLANSKALGDHIERKLSLAPGSVMVIPNGAELPPVREPAIHKPEPPNVVMVANYRPHKGLDLLLDVACRIQQDVCFRVVGHGMTHGGIPAAISQMGLQDRVVLLGGLSDISEELKRAKFAVHTSRSEGLCNAIIEEMSYGLPVLAWRIGGNEELIQDGTNGFLFELGDVDSMAQAIDTLLTSADMHSQMAAAARASVQHLSWDRAVSQYSYIYQNLT